MHNSMIKPGHSNALMGMDLFPIPGPQLRCPHTCHCHQLVVHSAVHGLECMQAKFFDWMNADLCRFMMKFIRHDMQCSSTYNA